MAVRYGVAAHDVAGAAFSAVTAAGVCACRFYGCRGAAAFARRLFENAAAPYGSPDGLIFGVADDGVAVGVSAAWRRPVLVSAGRSVSEAAPLYIFWVATA